jgi:hypothetical protein
VAIVALEGMVVLVGDTEDGLAVTAIRERGRPLDVVLGGRGPVVRFEAEGDQARVGWLEGGRARFRRVDLGTGELLDLGGGAAPSEVVRGPR